MLTLAINNLLLISLTKLVVRFPNSMFQNILQHIFYIFHITETQFMNIVVAKYLLLRKKIQNVHLG
jgi:hypothetical protein